MQDQPRLHVDPDAALLRDGANVPMREDQAHYLGVVLRRGPGDGVRLFNGRDGEWDAAIEHLHKRGRGAFRLLRRVRAPVAEDGPALLFAPLKRDATDLVVRMATELGVRSIRPVLTERTNASRVNLDRLRAIAMEAAEQCERLTMPDIGEPVRLADLLGGWPSEQTLWAAIERSASGPSPAQPGAGLLVGPEGGFSPHELDLLRSRRFVVGLSLGSRILRAETAAAAGLACLQGVRERWGLVPEGAASL
ncbi:16S rRNA (uracil(1498)-N(3))-methyltransferase [Lichenicoccus sp.]|uniref:16S rRNA (uracil(1498)-N(3))-methyltransferase n=1 Tax=Lichenicoccus sp. TaxID=2781899 RepID=UPI003D0E49F0